MGVLVGWGGEASLHIVILGSRLTPAGVSTNILGPGVLCACRRVGRPENMGQRFCEPGLDAEDITSRHSSVSQDWSEVSTEYRGGRGNLAFCTQMEKEVGLLEGRVMSMLLRDLQNLSCQSDF